MLTPSQASVFRRAGKPRIVSRLTLMISTGRITVTQAARVLAAYRDQVSTCR
jgi:hypothetical protein